jgi:hypothetical protein
MGAANFPGAKELFALGIRAYHQKFFKRNYYGKKPRERISRRPYLRPVTARS